MIHCTSCKRLFAEGEKHCPFCGPTPGMTRREAGLAAAALFIAPAIVVAQDPKPAYGVPRPRPEPELAPPAAAEALVSDWLPSVGILDHAGTWASQKPGAVVSYQATHSAPLVRASTGTLAVRLVKVKDASVVISIECPNRLPDQRTMNVSKGITEDARIASEAKETLEIDGTKYECVARTYEMPGRTFKAWLCKDAPYGIVKVEMDKETTRLVKAKESVKVGAGTYDCSVWETADGDRVRKVWRSDALPGAIVKLVETKKTEGGEVKVTLEASATREGK